jgi:transcriptional regulator with XRE-family HTH domain
MTQISDGIDSREAVVALLLDDLAPPRLGSLLRGARKRGSLTRREVAARVETTTSELRRYERGDTPVPARMIASLAECYGADLTSQLATRAPIEVEPHRVVVGNRAAHLESVDDDEVLTKYVGLVQRVRNSQPGEPIALRADDLIALSSALGHDSAEVEARIVELLGCTAREARSLHAEMLRRKLVVPVAGLVASLAVVTGVGVAAASTGTPAHTTHPAARSTPTTIVAAPVTVPHVDTPAPAPAATEAPTTTEAPATTEAPTTTPAPTPETPAVATPAPLPRPVITPDTTPMSIPPHESVTIIEP